MAREALTELVQCQAAELEHLSGGSKIVRDIRANTRSAGAQRNGERNGASGNLKALLSRPKPHCKRLHFSSSAAPRPLAPRWTV